jgi:hypothetical protein
MILHGEITLVLIRETVKAFTLGKLSPEQALDRIGDLEPDPIKAMVVVRLSTIPMSNRDRCKVYNEIVNPTMERIDGLKAAVENYRSGR